VLYSCIYAGTWYNLPAFSAQHYFERGEAEEDILPRCRASHGTNAPNPAQEWSKGGTDLDSKVME
jgi:hypothetical protein